ncbi:hypothetical protein LIER_16353 [Lithospermum erythrorhizon]|uniref:F-box protein n=1 Tax=Lithospermum erythrorhizon TaxID=34254 RepID=A0AAV3QAI5_LITER
MDTRIDFLSWLQGDLAFHILAYLDDPVDIIHASNVSRFWRHFVITNGVSKQMCLKKLPQLSNVECIIESKRGSTNTGSIGDAELELYKREHTVYASLLQALNKSTLSSRSCIEKAVGASSTDNYPYESIIKTLIPRDRFDDSGSYWSSVGQSDPAIPETLIYKLRANVCVITEIKIRPFEAFFEQGKPIYSAEFVRFRTGHPKSASMIEKDLVYLPLQQPADDKFVWTYTSQHFPMVQENRLQEFKLPEPILCIGGFLQIELSGRVQRNKSDCLFYICVAHIRVIGHPLFPAFDQGMLEPSEKILLKYYPEALRQTLQKTSDGEGNGNTRVLTLDGGPWGTDGIAQFEYDYDAIDF